MKKRFAITVRLPENRPPRSEPWPTRNTQPYGSGFGVPSVSRNRSACSRSQTISWFNERRFCFALSLILSLRGRGSRMLNATTSLSITLLSDIL